MVGLPGRGKSYVCRKLARYLNWLQHDTKVFNVGERRRVAAAATPGVPDMDSIKQHTGQLPVRHKSKKAMDAFNNLLNGKLMLTPPPSPATRILVNGEMPQEPPALDMLESLPPAMMEINRRYLEDSDEDTDEEEEEEEEEEQEDEEESHDPKNTNGDDQGIEQEQLAKLQMPPPPLPRIQSMDQTAGFFDPGNHQAANIREQVALGTMDELLDYILDRGGSVGIFDATNSTLERRKSLMERIRERAGPELGVLFLESVCFDETLLESNMRLKLSGPDYRDSDPVTALADFKQRIAMYEKQYVPLGEYEEKHNMQYLQIIDVGRKIVSHQIKGFLAAQANYYLLNFNLAPRQIWITRHGESVDNLSGKLGGDSDLSEYGRAYGQALTRFIKHEREAWEIHQREKALSTHFPPQAGDTTPPNPEYQTHGSEDGDEQLKSFCVWTSMLKRSVQTAQYFDEEDYDIKQMKMLDELNAGVMEGLTYEEIKSRYKDEYELRKRDKLHYRYPGAGGEGYLDVINRLRAVIVEAERMTDHLLLVCHRSVARVLLAYFKGLARDDVANLDVPLGMLYMLEPVSSIAFPETLSLQFNLKLTLCRNPTAWISKRTDTIRLPIGLTIYPM